MAIFPDPGYTNPRFASFEWDERKEALNLIKHGVSFREAQAAFLDPRCVIAEDPTHSRHEKRFYCMGRTAAGVLTVRFTYRDDSIRIFGAGYWRKGRSVYEKANPLHR